MAKEKEPKPKQKRAKNKDVERSTAGTNAEQAIANTESSKPVAPAQPVPQPEATQPVQAPQPETVQPAVQQPIHAAHIVVAVNTYCYWLYRGRRVVFACDLRRRAGVLNISTSRKCRA